ncbi:MAG: hypothetical protein M3442_19045 [Chloroflexota bacterium]|nr:hypothetical protein [Chloroflexota bacterium]
MLVLAERGLREIGYGDDLLRRDYAFADLLGVSDAVRRIPLAGFAQEPPSYRTACVGVFVASPGIDVADYSALGAPQLLEIKDSEDGDRGEVRRWKVSARGDPVLLERIAPEDVVRSIRARQAEWSPESILRARSIAFDAAPVQLDFFDAGLLPAIEAVVHTKLDRLLRETLAASKAVYRERHLDTLDYPQLFRLVFRLLAAKLFGDRGQAGRWLDSDPAVAIAEVERFYFRSGASEPVLADPATQWVAWAKIRSAFHLQNISVEALAYVYENTLVDDETRRQYGTHSTPREVAEYVVRRLPFETLPFEQRRVFEPFAGHAAFLIAALGRLRGLLPPKMTAGERHQYFVRMLAGMEIDPFAREVARLSLMLADYPNPDSWRLSSADVFTAPGFATELSRARAVLCNPPFGDFTAAERAFYAQSPIDRRLRSANKAAESLLRTLDRPPDLLGFVLPRSFIDGKHFSDARRRLVATYGSLELVALPDTAFQHSGVETVLLMAHGKGRPLTHLRSAEVAKHDYEHFVRAGRPSWEETATVVATVPAVPIAAPALWIRPLQRVWRALDGLPVLSDVAKARNGIYFGPSLRSEGEHLVSNQPRDGFRPGLVRVEDGFEPLVVRRHVYLNMDSAVMYKRSKAHLFSWDTPKVIVNGVRLSRGPWVVTGAPDREGLVVYHLFHALWPTLDVPVEVLAAIVNGPVANAFVSTSRTSRANRIETLNRIPIPRLNSDTMSAIGVAVADYRRERFRWLAWQRSPVDTGRREDEATVELLCRQALYRIDAAVLAAYDLAPRVERELLDFFAGHRRPGPVAFQRYYPDNFRPALPWRMLITGELERASARQTLQRLPVLHEVAVSEMVADLE